MRGYLSSGKYDDPLFQNFTLYLTNPHVRIGHNEQLKRQGHFSSAFIIVLYTLAFFQ